MSPFSPPPHSPLFPYRGPPRNPDRTRRATRVQKNVLQPKSPNPRQPANMRFSTKSRSRMESGLVRPVPKSPKGPGLKASISAPIPMIYPGGGEEPTIVRNAIPIEQGPMSPEDINAKIQAMLAAHKRLKEDNSPKPNAASRIVSKVASVLHLSDRKDRDRQIVVTPGKSPAEKSLQRLNVRDNLHRYKVQSDAGNIPMNIPRKPVPNSGSAVVTPQRTAPTHNAEALHKLTSAISEVDGSSRSRFSLDPFSSETGFEDDLEYRTLKATPEGSSTPRVGREPRQTTNDNGSPLPRKQSQAHESQCRQYQNQSQIKNKYQDHDQGQYQNQDYQNQDYQSQVCECQSIAETDSFMSDSSSEYSEGSAVPEAQHGEVGHKKHPSPSITWLKNAQDLQDALLNVSDASHRIQPAQSLYELRYGPGGPHWLTPRVPHHPRSPTPARHSWRTFESIRPDDVGADEIDELS